MPYASKDLGVSEQLNSLDTTEVVKVNDDHAGKLIECDALAMPATDHILFNDVEWPRFCDAEVARIRVLVVAAVPHVNR